MLTMRKLLGICIVSVVAGLMVGCGSGSGGGGIGGVGNNTVTMTVGSGPAGNMTPPNTALVSVTVCAPGTANCQTINGVSVDTGSSGLRILASQVTLPLAQEKGSDGNPLVECAQFVSFITWGPMKMADIKMAGEVASNVPIQVIGDPAFPNIPANCQSSAPNSAQTVQALGANGILGVGLFMQDCGPACAPGTPNNPDFYYSCPTQPSTCSASTATATQQAQNPVWMFPADNNGVILQLPQIPATGAPSAQGTLIFGIGTQSNNGLGNATVFDVAADGTFTTVYKGTAYPESFIDSGSNGIFFLTSAITGIPNCAAPGNGFYCPQATVQESATNQGFSNRASNTVNFSIANANNLPSNFAFNDIGGENAGPPSPSFDWGLPFFFGRNVYTAIEQQPTPGGTGPYFAY